MANTRETMGEQACLDALVANTLTSFEDDGVTKVGANCLRYNTALTEIKLPLCKEVEFEGLCGCANLEVVDMLGTGTINTNAFYGDTKLAHLLLRGSTMTTLSNANAFTSTPISLGNGAVYVPSDLLATYKADANWSTYTILPTTDYPKSGLPETVTDSWSDIIAASANGTYSSKYAVGDVKSMVIDGTTYYFQLAAMDADVLASDGTTTVSMTWILFRKFYGMKSSMNSGYSTSGGWEASAMRAWLNDTVLPLMPSEVQAAIKEVRKYSDTYESAIVHDQVTADKLWIPSGREVSGVDSFEQTGPKYTDVFKSMGSKIRYDQTGSAYRWWLRSVYSSSGCRCISTNGSFDMSNVGSSFGVVLGFCI